MKDDREGLALMRLCDCDYNCSYTEPYGFVPEAGCPVHDHECVPKLCRICKVHIIIPKVTTTGRVVYICPLGHFWYEEIMRW